MLICQNSYLFVNNKGTQLTTVPNKTLQNAYDYLLPLLREKRLKDETIALIQLQFIQFAHNG